MESSSQTAVSLSHAHPNRTLVIMAKAPKPGMVKTRLMERLPPSAVTALYRCLLEDTLALAKSLTRVEVAVMCPESDQDELAELFGDAVQVVAQKGEGLAAGLTSVFRHFATAERQYVIAFNSDSPHLAPQVLNRAFEILTTHDVVVGPTHDGGYYLVGAKSAHLSLFEGDGMGTKSALDKLLMRAKVLGLSTGFTEPFYDIDIANDLVELARELRIAPMKAPRTAAWFNDWEQDVKQLRQGLEEM
jgi:rSAM/selenodomain-associated transferase 1